MTAVYLIAGLAALIAGAELLVRGASRIASLGGISPLVIGLTVVAFGTSAPELAVSINAAAAGQTDVSLGNILGSNTFNVLFILGVSALVTPLVVSSQLIRLDVPVMIGASVLVGLLGLDGEYSRAEGALLLVGVVAYTVFLIWLSKTAGGDAASDQPGGKGGVAASVVAGLAGLALLVIGSRWLVAGAVSIAEALGVSQLVIGLTVIAAGTSLPEVVTSIVAAVRGERDIAVGNIVGSNIFNLLCVLGAAAATAPAGIEVSPSALRFDIPVMIAAAVVCLPIFFTGMQIARWEGALLLGYYVAYTTYLVLAASRHAAQHVLADAMLWFVFPLTAVTLGVLAWRASRPRP